MNNSDFNIITPSVYYKNIGSYQYDAIIEVKSKEYSKFIYKDLLKSFYCNLIDTDIDLKEESQYDDELIKKSSQYSYLIIDRSDIKSYCPTYELFISFLMELVYYLDINEVEKFDIIYSLINYVGIDYNYEDESFTEIDYVIKLNNVARNLKSNPIWDDNVEEIMTWVEGYNYNNLVFNY
tara:strand:- start:24702 stop:25241 length:540 start_codon:yes stop_codon:yes gene_type:complete